MSTCYQYQLQSTKKIEVSPTIHTPTTIFSELYFDIMIIPKAYGYHYIIATRDNLIHVAEGQALHKADAKAIAKFFWKEIICWYGHIAEVVTDNNSEVKEAFTWLLAWYDIPQIKISSYNNHANKLVK